MKHWFWGIALGWTLGAGAVFAQEAAQAPAQQQQVQQALEAYRQQWSESPNPLEQFLIRKQRKAALAKLLPERQFLEWVGVLTLLRATPNGKAYLEITIADPQRLDAKVRPRVGTWNNAYVDLEYGTLVLPGTELYDWLATFREGEWVRFTGLAFPGDEDHLKEASTEAADSMGVPLFITKFEYLERVSGPSLPDQVSEQAEGEEEQAEDTALQPKPLKQAEGEKPESVGAGHAREPATSHQPPATVPQLTVRFYADHQLSTYEWDYADYLKRWSEQARFYWARHPPTEYLSGEHPQGGVVRVTATVDRNGRILNAVADATESLPASVQESALRAVDTVLLPPLPYDFPDEQLRVTFRFRMAPLPHLEATTSTTTSKVGMSPKTQKRLARRKQLREAKQLWHEQLRKAVESSFHPLQRHRPDSELLLELSFSRQSDKPALRLLSRQGSPAFLLGVLEGLAKMRWPAPPELLLDSQPILHLRVVP